MVQRQVALRALGGVPGVVVELEHVSAGLGGAEVRGAVVRNDTMELRLPRLAVHYSGWALLTRRVVEVSDLTATDWDLTLRDASQGSAAAASTGTEGAAQAFAGFLAPLQLPAGTRIDNVQIGGRIHLSDAQVLECSVQGRPIAPGAEATTDLHLTWADRSAASAFPTLDWVGRLVVRTGGTGAVQQLALDGSLAVPAAKEGAPEHGLATLD